MRAPPLLPLAALSAGLLVALVACGGTPRAEPTARRAEPPPVAARPCLEAPSASASAAALSLDGRWYLLEPNDDDVEGIFDILGETGSGWAERPEQSMSLEVVRREGSSAILRVRTPAGEQTVILALEGEGRATAAVVGDDDLLLARRKVPVAPAILGTWEAEEADGTDRITMEVSATQVTLHLGARTRTAEVSGLADEEGSYSIVIHAREEGRETYLWGRFHPLNEHVMLIGGGDDYRVAYRPGHRPAWLGTARRRPEPPPPELLRSGP